MWIPVIAIGGTQAIAALTYGAGFIPQVDKIVGPGNAFVAAAKKLAFGTVDIDMIAGPSEVLVIADHTANPTYVAADLLSQAEHDKLASAVLLTDSMAQAQAISCEMERQAKQLPRWDIIKESVANYGCAIVFDDLKDACRMADVVAPEHLEVVPLLRVSCCRTCTTQARSSSGSTRRSRSVTTWQARVMFCRPRARRASSRRCPRTRF